MAEKSLEDINDFLLAEEETTPDEAIIIVSSVPVMVVKAHPDSMGRSFESFLVPVVETEVEDNE